MESSLLLAEIITTASCTNMDAWSHINTLQDDVITLTLSQCTLHGPVYTGMPLADSVYTGIPLDDPANIAGHTGTVACWEVTWPNDLQTRRSQYTGIPLDRLHWNHTGWCYRPVVFQWQSSVNLHNWNILEDQWSRKYTRMLLEPHWLMLAASGIPVVIQC